VSDAPPLAVSGGLAAVFAHPDDETFGAAGALALAADRGLPSRVLLATRGEAGAGPDADPEETAVVRRDEMRCAAERIGLDEVTILDGYRDGGIADEPFERLIDDITDWLATRRPEAVITFGPHGVTYHPDHIVVGNATRWAVERLGRLGQGPSAVYVVAPVFGPGAQRYDLSAEEQSASHRIDITAVAERKLAALECHASQADTAEPIADLRAALESRRPIYEGYRRVTPEIRPPMVRFHERLI
jgi:LmbE family N-acetylglucosaminyl deacetylase